jgi:ketosteroid isomerase-like protein
MTVTGYSLSVEPTTPDPVERTRVFFETMDREWDFDALAGFFAPDAVWDLSESHLGVYEGVAAIRDFLVGYWATWEDHHHAIEEILDFGHGVLSVAVWEDGRPRDSNARVQARHLQVFEWVGGEIVRITGYPDPDAARAAAERVAQERG